MILYDMMRYGMMWEPFNIAAVCCFLQAAAKDKASQGRVVAIGEGRTSSEGEIVPCPFKPGDNVKFFEYAPVEIKVGVIVISVVSSSS